MNSRDPANHPVRTLSLIRHGQSLANAGGVTMDHPVIPLTDIGQRQAAMLAELLPATPTVICTSPFLRARQTSAPYCARTGLAGQALEGAQEFENIDSTLMQGMTGAERQPLADRYWAEAGADERMGPRAETFREFAQRVAAFRTTRLSSLPDGAVLFGHGMWIAMLVWQFMGFSTKDDPGMRAFRRFQLGLPMPNGALYRITELAPDQWTVAADEAVMRAMAGVSA